MIIKARVKTKQPRFSVEEGPVWKISLRSPPEKNRANQELVREMSKRYGKAVILSGFRSGTKTLHLDPSKP